MCQASYGSLRSSSSSESRKVSTPLSFPSSLSLAALSITFHFLSLSWLHAVLVIDDCLKCLPSPFHRESCNFVTLARSGGPRRGLTPPTTEFISLSISRKCIGEHVTGTQGQVAFEGLHTDFFFYAAGDFFFTFMPSLRGVIQKQPLGRWLALVALNCNVWIHHRGLSGLRTNHAGIVKSLCSCRLIILWVLLPFMEPMVFFT